jgi:hypothetical protein
MYESFAPAKRVVVVGLVLVAVWEVWSRLGEAETVKFADRQWFRRRRPLYTDLHV